MLCRSLLIELRRLLSLVFMPWFGIVSFCFIVSWYSLFFLGLDVLLAPIVKFWLLLKPLLLKTLPALLVWFWTHTGAKVIGWLTELAALLTTILGGWKAWSVKKIARQVARFFLSLSARFVAVSVLFNLLFGHERRGVKLLPGLAIDRLRTTWLGRLVLWWKHSSERAKRLVLGVVLCVVLIFAGQAMLGISVLLFDLAWELILLLWRFILYVWRLLSPYVLRMIPNFIGNFVTRKLLPLAADVIPIIKDDHRVIYLRINIRRHIRRMKAWLYLKSRSRRHSVRKRITPLVNDSLRARKSALLDAAAKYRASKDKKYRNKS